MILNISYTRKQNKTVLSRLWIFWISKIFPNTGNWQKHSSMFFCQVKTLKYKNKTCQQRVLLLSFTIILLKKQQHHNFLLITPTKWKNIISEYRVVGLVLRNVITHVSSWRDENRHQQQWLRKGICESIVIKWPWSLPGNGSQLCPWSPVISARTEIRSVPHGKNSYSWKSPGRTFSWLS